jgi:hypothetical protein
LQLEWAIPVVIQGRGTTSEQRLTVAGRTKKHGVRASVTGVLKLMDHTCRDKEGVSLATDERLTGLSKNDNQWSFTYNVVHPLPTQTDGVGDPARRNLDLAALKFTIAVKEGGQELVFVVLAGGEVKILSSIGDLDVI